MWATWPVPRTWSTGTKRGCPKRGHCCGWSAYPPSRRRRNNARWRPRLVAALRIREHSEPLVGWDRGLVAHPPRTACVGHGAPGEPWLPPALSLGRRICISNALPGPQHILIRHLTWEEMDSKVGVSEANGKCSPEGGGYWCSAASRAESVVTETGSLHLAAFPGRKGTGCTCWASGRPTEAQCNLLMGCSPTGMHSPGVHGLPAVTPTSPQGKKTGTLTVQMSPPTPPMTQALLPAVPAA